MNEEEAKFKGELSPRADLKSGNLWTRKYMKNTNRN